MTKSWDIERKNGRKTVRFSDDVLTFFSKSNEPFTIKEFFYANDFNY